MSFETTVVPGEGSGLALTVGALKKRVMVPSGFLEMPRCV